MAKQVLVVVGGFFIAGGLATSCAAPQSRERHEAWLAKVRSEIVTITPDRVDANNDGRWVHLACDVSGCEETFTDPPYGISRNCFSLTRHVEVYTTDGESPVVWGGCEPNDPPELKNMHWRVEKPRLGAFVLSDEMVHDFWSRISGVNGDDRNTESNADPINWEKRLNRQLQVRWPRMSLSENAEPPPAQWKLMPDGVHWLNGPNVKRPMNGQRRIGYSCVQFPDRHITVLARQTGNTLQGDPASSGNRRFTCIRPGKLPLDEIFNEASSDNERVTSMQQITGWCFVGAGVLLVSIVITLNYRFRRAGLLTRPY